MNEVVDVALRKIGEDELGIPSATIRYYGVTTADRACNWRQASLRNETLSGLQLYQSGSETSARLGPFNQISELEVQLDNQKKLNLDIQYTFEEHDRKQEEIIKELVLKKRELEKSMLLKRREGHCRASSSQEYVDTETQTPDQPPTNAPHTGTLFSSSALLLDIAQLKTDRSNWNLWSRNVLEKSLTKARKQLWQTTNLEKLLLL
ncbi:hypothetical protein J6590_051511 [Homalodisca vitripennis]|nr:hypothetical protein J6590_051511 [Homalodisca vitripennis]